MPQRYHSILDLSPYETNATLIESFFEGPDGTGMQVWRTFIPGWGERGVVGGCIRNPTIQAPRCRAPRPMLIGWRSASGRGDVRGCWGID